MNISLSKQTPMVINLIPRHRRKEKEKAVVVVGATGTGKSRLSIDLATRFDAEVINSDKMQVYTGLDVVTNKVTEDERRGVPHHLLGFADPAADFGAREFVRHASAAADDITARGRMPIIAGGSNSFVKALVVDDHYFRSRYDYCFLWVDVAAHVLGPRVSGRVDRMVGSGLVEEARGFFSPAGDYSRGARRAIGVPELDGYFRSEGGGGGGGYRERLLEKGIDQIKFNTRALAGRQRQNIMRLAEHLERRMHRLDGERPVEGLSARIVAQFLREDHVDFVSAIAAGPNRPAAGQLITSAVGR
ncbi:adenylate isopentenyltransferase 5, chloroplastic-like [Salvia hispanica]|uniref:adenylate isopentenyltransferase 5, chloroplastic-like n=1 Tax=Salvia hispanica TaxID=49212 RepID=UPI0020096528|nr:adenylate isopentenyltransferase 5, chloroplastic-like [Salvia hispanica]